MPSALAIAGHDHTGTIAASRFVSHVRARCAHLLACKTICVQYALQLSPVWRVRLFYLTECAVTWGGDWGGGGGGGAGLGFPIWYTNSFHVWLSHFVRVFGLRDCLSFACQEPVVSAVKRELAVRACRAASNWSQAKVCSVQQHPPCLVGLDASPFGFVPPCLCVWCGQPDRVFLCLCVVWSAGQSLSMSLCGVVSRIEPFPHSEHRFPAPSFKLCQI